MVVFHAGQVFVLEFKVAQVKSDVEAVLNKAISQIQERGYAEKYRTLDEPIHLIGLVFGQTERNLIGIRAVTV